MLNIVRAGPVAGVDAHRASSLRTQNLRWYLERSLEDRLRSLVAQPESSSLAAVVDELRRSARSPSPTAAVAVDRFATKAPYLGWEADPHTLALASLELPLKGPVAAIQSGEYGVGHGDAHATIYRSCLDALGFDLDDALDRSPAEAFAFANAAWLFGADPRLRGAAVGQLCMLEMDSVAPCAAAIEEWDRLGLPVAGRRWYDVHVLADEEHDRVVREQLIPTLEQRTPGLVDDATWGAAVTQALLGLLDAAVLRRTR
jgi:hypothetical protein